MTEPRNQEAERPKREPELQPDRNAELPRSYNIFKNVHTGDDSCQLIVSTTGVVVHATDVSTGARTTHAMGQMSEKSIQQLFQPVSQHTAGQDVQRTQQENASWQEKYGKGRTISWQ